MRDYTKNQLTGVLYDRTVTKGFAKSIKSFNTLVFFSLKGDFGSNIIHGFSFEYSFADFLTNKIMQDHKKNPLNNIRKKIRENYLEGNPRKNL